MPDIETFGLEQVCVLWPAVGRDAHGGVIVGAAVQMSCRWKWSFSETMQTQEATIPVDAVVRVARQVLPDSLMWLGRLQDLADPALGPQDPTPFGLMQVKAYHWCPDVKNRAFSMTLGLVRYRQQLPMGAG